MTDIQINLSDPSFKPSKKFYQRVKWCFEEKLTRKFNFLISFEDGNIGIAFSLIDLFL